MRLKGDLGFKLKGGFGFGESVGLQGQGCRVWRGVLSFRVRGFRVPGGLKFRLNTGRLR